MNLLSFFKIAIKSVKQVSLVNVRGGCEPCLGLRAKRSAASVLVWCDATCLRRMYRRRAAAALLGLICNVL